NHDFDHSSIAPRLPREVVVVGVVHSDDPEHYAHARQLGRYWDGAVAVSRAIAAELHGIAPELHARTRTIPYGVGVPGEPPRPGNLTAGRLDIVYAGRLDDYQKRVFDLPPIFERLAHAGVDARLPILGGGGGVGTRLRKMFGPAARDGTVRFAGVLDHAATLEAFEQGDVLLLTSAVGGLPLTMLEALARGCIPVVSDIRSGIPELIEDGINGFRVPVGDTGAFADRLRSLAMHPGLRRRMSIAAHSTIANGPYRMDTMTDRYLELFDELWEDAVTGRFARPTGPVRRVRRGRRIWRSRVVPRLRVAAFYVRRLLDAA